MSVSDQRLSAFGQYSPRTSIRRVHLPHRVFDDTGNRSLGLVRQFGIEVFIITGLATLAIALLTVIYQAVKAAVADPTHSLRYQ